MCAREVKRKKNALVPVSSNVNCPIRQLKLMKEAEKEEMKRKMLKLFDLRSCENKQL
jgi:hypothetical protein